MNLKHWKHLEKFKSKLMIKQPILHFLFHVMLDVSLLIFRQFYTLIYNTYYLLGILDYAFLILLYFAIVIDVIEIFSGTLNIYLLMIDCKTFITPIDNFFIEI